MNMVHRIRFSISTLTRVINLRFLPRCMVLAWGIILTTSWAIQTASAETRNITVPFDFSIGRQILPAGNYSVELGMNEAYVTLKKKDGPQSFTWTIGPGDPAPTDARVVLRFDQIGDSRALQSVQFKSLITSRLDKKAMRNEQASTQVVLAQ